MIQAACDIKPALPHSSAGFVRLNHLRIRRVTKSLQSLVSEYHEMPRHPAPLLFNIKIKGDKTTPGADLGDNDFVGKPEIVSCEAIVYTKDGDGWIGAKIEKK